MNFFIQAIYGYINMDICFVQCIINIMTKLVSFIKVNVASNSIWDIAYWLDVISPRHLTIGNSLDNIVHTPFFLFIMCLLLLAFVFNIIFNK